MKIGLIGAGLMGYPMAEKILENKYPLTVFNRTKEKALPLKEKGAVIVDNAIDVIQSSEKIILMLSDFSAIKEILFDEKIKSGLHGKSILQMGTISPLENEELLQFSQNADCEYLEAPVLGSINEVRNKKLIVLVGGDKKLFDEYSLIFEIFGSNIYYIGEVGKASALKLALNQLIASLTAAFSISFSYVKKYKIDSDLFMDILRNSALYAPTFDKKLANYENQNFDKTNFPLQHLLKDVRLVKDESNRFNINSGILEALEIIIKRALDKGYRDKDYSSLFMGIYDK